MSTRFKELADQMVELQAKKNKDYGNAFTSSCNKYGPVSALTRLNDKLYRLDTLLYYGCQANVKSESVKDTLTDLAAYALMTIEWLENLDNAKKGE